MAKTVRKTITSRKTEARDDTMKAPGCQWEFGESAHHEIEFDDPREVVDMICFANQLLRIVDRI